MDKEKDIKRLIEKVIKFKESFKRLSRNKHIDVLAAYDMIDEDLQNLYFKLIKWLEDI